MQRRRLPPLPRRKRRHFRNGLDRTEKREKLNLEWAKIVLTAIGSFALIAGLLLGNHRWREDHRIRWEKEMASARLSRMTAIAETYDSLYAETAGIFDHANYLSLALRLQFSMLEMEVSTAKLVDEVDDSCAEDLLAISSEFRKSLSEKKYSIQEWAGAVALLSRWNSDLVGPTPDFAVYFSAELVGDWSATADAARSALNHRFSPFAAFAEAGQEREALDRFSTLAATFQRRIHEEVAEASRSAIWPIE